MEKERVGAVIVAAGKSERMGGMDKVFADLNGTPLVAGVIETFENCKAIDEIVIVLGQENLERGRKLVRKHGWSKVSQVCSGGARRQDSVREGLRKLEICRWVVIHDGARPLLTEELIDKGLTEAVKTGAAIAAVPVKDTIKISSPDGFVQSTPSRATLWAVQTPQVFRFDLISEAHETMTEDVTDDAMMVEKLGHRVQIYMGSDVNLKVTTPRDLAMAAILQKNLRPDIER